MYMLLLIMYKIETDYLYVFNIFTMKMIIEKRKNNHFNIRIKEDSDGR